MTIGVKEQVLGALLFYKVEHVTNNQGWFSSLVFTIASAHYSALFFIRSAVCHFPLSHQKGTTTTNKDKYLSGVLSDTTLTV